MFINDKTIDYYLGFMVTIILLVFLFCAIDLLYIAKIIMFIGTILILGIAGIDRVKEMFSDIRDIVNYLNNK